MVDRNYIDVGDLRTHFGDSGNKLDETKLTTAIAAASRAIDKRTGRRFYLDDTAQVRTYRPRDGYTAWVDDIGTTTGLIVKTGTGGTYTTTIASTSYELWPRNGGADSLAYAWWRIVLLDGTFPLGGRYPTLQVTAKFGWATVPDEVSQACLLISAALFRRADAPFGIASFGEFGAMRIARDDPDVKALLSPYLKIGFGD